MSTKDEYLSRMKIAIEQAKLSKSDRKEDPKVGAILVLPDGKTFTGRRGENRIGDHAEYTVLEKTDARNLDLTGSTLFTTLEPCTTRNHPKIHCAQRILNSRIGKVWIGMLDPNPDVYAKGLRMLDLAGVDWEFFPKDLRDELKELNREFINHFARQSIVELGDYWSVSALKEASYFTKQDISTLLWGKEYGETELERHYYQLMEEARKSKEISAQIMYLDCIFPRSSFVRGAVGVKEVTLEVSLLLRNPSKVSPIIFTPSPSYLQYTDKDWLRHGLLLNIEISSQEKLINLQPCSYSILPIKVEICLRSSATSLPLLRILSEAKWPHRGILFEQYLVAGQALKHWLVSGIDELTFQLQLINGEKVSKKFGLRLDEHSQSELKRWIEEVEVEKCHEALSKISEWIDKLTNVRLRQRYDSGLL